MIVYNCKCQQSFHWTVLICHEFLCHHKDWMHAWLLEHMLQVTPQDTTQSMMPRVPCHAFRNSRWLAVTQTLYVTADLSKRFSMIFLLISVNVFHD